jgi:hypothetical protein
VNNVTLPERCVTQYYFAKCNFEIHLNKTIMPLLTILIVLIIAGVLLWLVNNYIPMDHKIKTIFNVVVVIAVVIWLLKIFGVFSSLSSIHI